MTLFNSNASQVLPLLWSIISERKKTHKFFSNFPPCSFVGIAPFMTPSLALVSFSTAHDRLMDAEANQTKAKICSIMDYRANGPRPRPPEGQFMGDLRRRGGWDWDSVDDLIFVDSHLPTFFFFVCCPFDKCHSFLRHSQLNSRKARSTCEDPQPVEGQVD